MFDFDPRGSWSLANVPGKHDDKQRVCVRVGHQREHLSDPRHEFSPARAAAKRDRNRESTSFRKCRCSRSARRRSSATCRVLSSTWLTRQGGERFALRRLVSTGSLSDRQASQRVSCHAAPGGASRKSGYLAREVSRRQRQIRRAHPARSGVVLRRLSASALTTTVSPERIQPSPRRYEQDKIFAKLTWRLTPSLQLIQSVHNELWVNPEHGRPFDSFATGPTGPEYSATLRRRSAN